MLFTLETSTSKTVGTVDACLSLKWVMVQEGLTRVLVSDLHYEIEDPLWEEAEREESCGFHFCFLSLFRWKMDLIKKTLQEIKRESATTIWVSWVQGWSKDFLIVGAKLIEQ